MILTKKKSISKKCLRELIKLFLILQIDRNPDASWSFCFNKRVERPFCAFYGKFLISREVAKPQWWYTTL